MSEFKEGYPSPGGVSREQYDAVVKHERELESQYEKRQDKEFEKRLKDIWGRITEGSSFLAPITEAEREANPEGTFGHEVLEQHETDPGYAIHAAWAEYQAALPRPQSMLKMMDGREMPNPIDSLNSFFFFLSDWKKENPSGFKRVIAEYLTIPVYHRIHARLHIGAKAIHGGAKQDSNVMADMEEKARAAYRLMHEMGMDSFLVTQDADHPNGLKEDEMIESLAGYYDYMSLKALEAAMKE